MKTNRRGFIGASILAAIPSFDVIGGVISPEKAECLIRNPCPSKPERYDIAIVSCWNEPDPEISVSGWGMPQYLFRCEVHGDRELLRMISDAKAPVGRVVKNEIVFCGNSGDCVSLVESGGSRVLLKNITATGGVRQVSDGVWSPYLNFSFLFQEVPAVVFKEKRATAEEIFGVGKFPGLGC